MTPGEQPPRLQDVQRERVARACAHVELARDLPPEQGIDHLAAALKEIIAVIEREARL